eukprot:ANDGO_02448.mRNA.1 hypothetical protein GUITHDRAFT_77168
MNQQSSSFAKSPVVDDDFAARVARSRARHHWALLRHAIFLRFHRRTSTGATRATDFFTIASAVTLKKRFEKELSLDVLNGSSVAAGEELRSRGSIERGLQYIDVRELNLAVLPVDEDVMGVSDSTSDVIPLSQLLGSHLSLSPTTASSTSKLSEADQELYIACLTSQMMSCSKLLPNKLLRAYCPDAAAHFNMSKIIFGGHDQADLQLLQRAFNISGADHIGFLSRVRRKYAPENSRNLLEDSQTRVRETVLGRFKELQAQAKENPLLQKLWLGCTDEMVRKCEDDISSMKIKRSMYHAPLHVLEKLGMRGKRKHAVGQIAIQIVACRDLFIKHASKNRLNVFVEVTFNKEGPHKTEVISDTMHPSWANEVFAFDVNTSHQQDNASALFLQVLDHSSSSEDGFLGQLTIPLSSLIPSEPTEGWFALQKRSAKSLVTGDIYVILLYEELDVITRPVLVPTEVPMEKTASSTSDIGKSLCEIEDILCMKVIKRLLALLYNHAADGDADRMMDKTMFPAVVIRSIIDFAVFYQLDPFRLQLCIAQAATHYFSSPPLLARATLIPFASLWPLFHTILDDAPMGLERYKDMYKNSSDTPPTTLSRRPDVCRKIVEFAADLMHSARLFDDGRVLGHTVALLRRLSQYPRATEAMPELSDPQAYIQTEFEQMAVRWLAQHESKTSTFKGSSPATITCADSAVIRIESLTNALHAEFSAFCRKYSPFVPPWAAIFAPIARIYFSAVKQHIEQFSAMCSSPTHVDSHGVRLVPVVRAFQECLQLDVPEDMWFDVYMLFTANIDEWVRILCTKTLTFVHAVLATDLLTAMDENHNPAISNSVVDLFSILIQAYQGFSNMVHLPKIIEKKEMSPGEFLVDDTDGILGENGPGSGKQDVSLQYRWHSEVITVLVEGIHQYIVHLRDRAIALSKAENLGLSTYVAMNNIQTCMTKTDEMMSIPLFSDIPESIRSKFDSIIPCVRSSIKSVLHAIVHNLQCDIVTPHVANILKLHVSVEKKKIAACISTPKPRGARRSSAFPSVHFVDSPVLNFGISEINSLLDELDIVLQQAYDCLEPHIFRMFVEEIYSGGIVKSLRELCMAIPREILNQEVIETIHSIEHPLKDYFVSDNDEEVVEGVSDNQFASSFLELRGLYNLATTSTAGIFEILKCSIRRDGEHCQSIETEATLALLTSRAQFHKDKAARQYLQEVSRILGVQTIESVESKWIRPALILTLSA